MALEFEDIPGLMALANLAAPGAQAAADQDDAGELPQSLRALLAAMDPAEHEPLWARVLKVGEKHLQGPPPAADEQPDVSAAGAEDAAFEAEQGRQAVHAIATLLTTFADCALEGTKLPPSFAEVLVLMQDMLLSLTERGTQALVARALEKVVMGPFEGREDYYGGVLMYLIGNCLTQKTTNADVARLYKVRQLFAELDWEHESIESMKLQMMRCVASPNFVRAPNGPDLMALFYTVHPAFTAEVHGTVKNQVMYCRATSMKGYATALYKAWKTSEGGTRVQIELCVQDWVVMAIKTLRKSAERARNMLEEVHRHHHDDQINELLCRLFGPVLWRSLKVANWQVRENSARLLQYIFPLIPSELGVAEKEQELIRQLRMLRETLEDPCESVRKVGIGAVCSILKNYWDMMPSAEIAELLTLLRDRCSRDKRAPTVRAAVAEGFSWIIQNPMSHPTMGAVLPALADLLNDRSPLVRAAFVNLLQAVALCKGISVNTIVSNDCLLLRLATEHTEGQAERLQRGLQGKAGNTADAGPEGKASPEMVAKRLTKLMSPSLFVQDIVQQVARCDYFMKHSPLALLAMLSHAPDFIPAPDRVKLAAALFRYGLREASGILSSGNAGGTVPRPKSGVVATMLRVVGVLLEGAANEAPKKRKKGVQPSAHFPPELEDFIYEHIREEDFLHLLRASHEDSGNCTQLREDLLFALSSLDPQRLQNTAGLVQHELTIACRANDSPYTLSQLAALMRTAVKWNLLGQSLEAAWERLQAAATRLGRRQASTEDLAGALTVTETAFRDPDVRAAMLRMDAAIVKDVVEQFVAAFLSAWGAGLAQVKEARTGEPALLGVSSGSWPRVVMFVCRAALHLDHRMGGLGAAVPQAAEACENAEGGVEPALPAPHPRGPFAGMIDATLGAIVSSVTGPDATEVLASLEVFAGRAGVRRRSKTCSPIVPPIDFEPSLLVLENLLEAVSVGNFLSVLKLRVAEGDDIKGMLAGVHFLSQVRALEDALWRWTVVADELRPAELGGTRLSRTWIMLGRLALQTMNSEATIPDVISSIKTLLGRVSEEVPEPDDLRNTVQALFSRLQYEPQMVQLVAGIIGGPPGSDPAEGEQAGKCIYHDRVQQTVEDLLPLFRNLQVKLRPQDVPIMPGDERRNRVMSSPTPQQAGGGYGRRSSVAPEPRHQQMAQFAPVEDGTVSTAGDDEGLDGQSVTESGRQSMSEGRRSFSVRSRSPPPGSESLFDNCFGEAGEHPRSSMASGPSLSVDGVSMSEAGEADPQQNIRAALAAAGPRASTVSGAGSIDGVPMSEMSAE